MSDKFYATRGNGNVDAECIRIWCGMPDRVYCGGGVMWYTSLKSSGTLNLGRMGGNVLENLFPDLKTLAPDSIREIAPPKIRFVD